MRLYVVPIAHKGIMISLSRRKINETQNEVFSFKCIDMKLGCVYKWRRFFVLVHIWIVDHFTALLLCRWCLAEICDNFNNGRFVSALKVQTITFCWRHFLKRNFRQSDSTDAGLIGTPMFFVTQKKNLGGIRRKNLTGFWRSFPNIERITSCD